MAIIQSGLDTTVATVDATNKALYTQAKGVTTVDYNHDDATMDSFERARVSEPRIVFENTFGAQTPTLGTTIWEIGTTGAGSSEALTTNLYATQLTQPTVAAAGRWIQSISHVRYAPGISTVLRFTFQTGILSAGSRHRLGMFTDSGTYPSTAGDGLYFENDAATLAFVRRYATQGAAGAEERVLQSSWNLDKMNGTGISGVTLNMSMAQHLVIEYQWLGVGTIRFGFETGSKGIVWAHEMQSVNAIAESWSRTGTLPVRAEVYNTTGTAVNSLSLINCVVQQEGLVDNRGHRYFGATSGATGKVGGTAVGLYPIMGIRQASTNALTLRAKVVPTSVSISVVAAGTVGVTPIQVALLMLGTPNTGATYAVTTAGSAVVTDIAATAATAITGTPIWTTVIPNVVGTYTFDLSNMANDNMNQIGAPASGTQAITGSSNLTLAAGPMIAAFTAAATLTASINWKEIV